MDYLHFQEVISMPRFDRFIQASSGNASKGLKLYRANLRLSQRLFGVISIFEIAFRNAIDKHYQKAFGSDWLYSQSNFGGYFWSKGCERSRSNVQKAIGNIGMPQSNDKVVAELTFGFWRNLFNSKEFAAGGSNLLQIFPKRLPRQNHTFFFQELYAINLLRNRIAHHEPIIFQASASSMISASYSTGIYLQIMNFFNWLDFHPGILLEDIDFVHEEVQKINALRLP